MSKQLVSIVVPVYNEEKNIAPFCHELKKLFKQLGSYDFEVLFVDDGSTDHTLREIRKYSAKNKRIGYIELVRNFGKEQATTAGIHMAKGSAVIMIDGDLQHPISLIPTFLEHWEKGAEVVMGVRNPVHKGSWKKFRSAMFYKLFNKVSDTHIVPNGTDFQLLDRVVVDEFNRFTERGRITRGLISWLGFPTTYVYFDVSERANGKATYSTIKLIRLATSSFISLSLFPLKLAGYLGMFISFFAGAFGLLMLFCYVFDDPLGFAFSGPAMLAVLILFLVGILLSCLGLIALYIGTIHNEVTNRPLYVVRNRKP